MIRTQITGIGDPFILRHGEKYYLYATSAKDGFRCYESDDLTDWKDAGYCYRDSAWGEDCFWAPEVYGRNGKFYMLYTARWKKNHSLRIGLAVSDDPKRPFRDVKAGPLFDLGYAAIDATLFLDDDGREYLYFVRDSSENIIDGIHTSVIYGAEIDSLDFSFRSEPVKISAPDCPLERPPECEWCWNEGPALWKHNGRYYLNYSINGYASPDYCVGCAEADSPLGPFVKYRHNPILRRGEVDFSGPGHNAFFTDKNGKLYTSFHIHTHPEAPGGDRRACIAEVRFDEKGEMYFVL